MSQTAPFSRPVCGIDHNKKKSQRKRGEVMIRTSLNNRQIYMEITRLDPE